MSNRKPNNKLDQNVVSAIKALVASGTPAQLLAQLYQVSESSVYMLAYAERRNDVEPMNLKLAKADANKRLQAILEA